MSNVAVQIGAPNQSQRAASLSKTDKHSRVLDLIGAYTLLFVLAPLLALIAFFVWFSDGGRVFFVQQRIGRDGNPFDLLKFRTMCVDAEERLQELLRNSPAARAEWARDQKLRHDPRVTPIGRFLRQFSLDELPQLFNVVRGEMSLVGPRPIVESEIVRYGHRFEHYCTVRPGITGLWQISGRNDVDYANRVALDRRYVEEWSFGRDVTIILRTIIVVLSSRGCY